MVDFDPRGTFMAATPLQNSPPSSPVEGVEEQFHRLESQWSRDTQFLSDPDTIMRHPAMLAIIAMGEEVVPLILREMPSQSSLLVWALPKITGENLEFEGNIGSRFRKCGGVVVSHFRLRRPLACPFRQSHGHRTNLGCSVQRPQMARAKCWKNKQNRRRQICHLRSLA